MNHVEGSTTGATLEVVIVNWNSGQWLRECLHALASARAAAAVCVVSRVTVVDNASSDGSCDGLEAALSLVPSLPSLAPLPLSIIRNAENRGFATACNQGAAGARGDYLLFLNPDATPTAEALDGVIALLEARANDRVRIAGVWLDNEEGPQTLWLGALPTARTFMLQALGRSQEWMKSVEPPAAGAEAASNDPGDPFGAFEVAVVGGAFLTIARPLFEEIEGFDERFFMYFEELDLCLRAHRRGARAMVASRIRVYHHSGASADRVRAKRLFYLLRSRLQYASAHFSTPETAVIAVLMLTTEPFLRLGRAAIGRGPDHFRDVAEAYARFAASLVAVSSDPRAW
jgi:N-acetylglucosaminyl-diphospho-decaprenol L-rhamnosyltransferase